jgi:hypothetical protein
VRLGTYGGVGAGARALRGQLVRSLAMLLDAQLDGGVARAVATAQRAEWAGFRAVPYLPIDDVDPDLLAHFVAAGSAPPDRRP